MRKYAACKKGGKVQGQTKAALKQVSSKFIKMQVDENLKQTLRSDLVNSWMKSEEKTKLRGDFAWSQVTRFFPLKEAVKEIVDLYSLS